MSFQIRLDHVHLARGFFPDPEMYAAARPYLTRMMSPFSGERLRAVRDANEALSSGALPAPFGMETQGNHYHGPASWGLEGYRIFPATAAFISKVNGQIVTGKIDHYSMWGSDEFRSACAILGMHSTCGFEIRAWVRDSLMLDGHDLSQEVINAPGFPGMAYNVYHGVLNSSNPFLTAAIPAKLERYEQVTQLINRAFAEKGVPPLIFERIRESSSFDNVLDKHVLGEIFDVLYDHFGAGRVSFDTTADQMAGFVSDLTGTEIDPAGIFKKARALQDDRDREYATYSAFIDMARAKLLAYGKPGFVMPGELECPSPENLHKIRDYDNSLLTYAILLRSAGGGEDPYFGKLIDHLFDNLGFDAVSWMPNRNRGDESEMIKQMSQTREILAISGMDVNKFLQKWLEMPYSADPWLMLTTFVLVGHEAALRSGLPGFTSKEARQMPFAERIMFFSKVGRFSDTGTGRIRESEYDRAKK